MTKAIFQVGPFECAGCARKIEGQLKGQVGVTKVKVFPQLRKIRTEFDETKISINRPNGRSSEKLGLSNSS